MVVDPASRGTRAGGCGPGLCLAALMVACHLAAQAAPPAPSLSYEPTGLGWSAAEVQRAAARQARPIVDNARKGIEAGCSETCVRLHAVFDRLVPVARAQTVAAARLSWTLSVVRTNAVEALALPDGSVLVSEAFVREAERSDAELAFILAHEMAHGVLEHERQALTFARTLLPRDVPRTAADMYTEIDHNFALLKSMEIVLQQGELEADELGLLMASAAGYDPRAQAALFEREAKEAAAQGTERRIIRTHPAPAHRLHQMRLRLPLAERVFRQATAAAP